MKCGDGWESLGEGNDWESGGQVKDNAEGAWESGDMVEERDRETDIVTLLLCTGTSVSTYLMFLV